MSGFFEVGKTYTDPTASDPYKAPEQSSVFLCQAVIQHPTTGDKFAVGWARPGAHPDEWLSLVVLGERDWSDHGVWTEGDKWVGVV